MDMSGVEVGLNQFDMNRLSHLSLLQAHAVVSLPNTMAISVSGLSPVQRHGVATALRAHTTYTGYFKKRFSGIKCLAIKQVLNLPFRLQVEQLKHVKQFKHVLMCFLFVF